MCRERLCLHNAAGIPLSRSWRTNSPWYGQSPSGEYRLHGSVSFPSAEPDQWVDLRGGEHVPVGTLRAHGNTGVWRYMRCPGTEIGVRPLREQRDTPRSARTVDNPRTNCYRLLLLSAPACRAKRLAPALSPSWSDSWLSRPCPQRQPEQWQALATTMGASRRTLQRSGDRPGQRRPWRRVRGRNLLMRLAISSRKVPFGFSYMLGQVESTRPPTVSVCQAASR